MSNINWHIKIPFDGVIYTPENAPQNSYSLLKEDGSLMDVACVELVNGVLIENETLKNQLIQQENQKNINKQARAYLASTDWYVIRKEETGVAIPQEILDARAAARASIVE
jgi:hypothetical protein